MKNSIEKYADLIIKKGINIQKGQILVINAPVETYDFTREVVKKAYLTGAKEVIVHWNDEVVEKYRYSYADEKVFDVFPEWKKESVDYYRKQGAAFLSIYAEDPEILKDVDKTRISRNKKARGLALKEYYEAIMGNSNQWCVVSIPTRAWAKAVFPKESEEKAIEKLWTLIFKIMRVDRENPVHEWDRHLQNFRDTMGYLNSRRFVKLRYKNSLGTDLEIGLPKGHRWIGGSEKTKSGVEFIANMPTEEIFTMPDKFKVNGVVYSSKPLIFGGSRIDNFKIAFKDGKVSDFTAEVGEEVLEKVLNIDENSKYLGEVALVPYDSPISKSGKVFFNTLYDENASCHLAVGSAYPVCLEGADKLSDKELEARGMNISMNHVDFMIGTEDMEIVGIEEDGSEVQIMKDGNFVFTL